MRCGPQSAKRLTWQRGLVAPDASTTLLFWGSWWSSTVIGRTRKSEMDHLFSQVLDSHWARTLTQYCARTSAGPYHPDVLDDSCEGLVMDRSDPPASPTDKQIGAEVARKFPPQVPDDLMIVVLTPPESSLRST